MTRLQKLETKLNNVKAQIAALNCDQYGNPVDMEHAERLYTSEAFLEDVIYDYTSDQEDIASEQGHTGHGDIDHSDADEGL